MTAKKVRPTCHRKARRSEAPKFRRSLAPSRRRHGHFCNRRPACCCCCPRMHWFSMNKSDRPRLRHRETSSLSASDSTPSRRHLLRRKRRAKSKEHGQEVVAPPSAAWRIHNILKAPPKASEWWEEASPSTDDIEESDSQSSSDQQQPNKSLSSDDSKRFQNRGYDAWEKARTAWRTPTTNKPRKKPPPVKRETVIRGVTSGKRTYELPGRMTLSDMIGVYHHIWSEQD